MLDEREIRLDHTTIQEFKNAGSDHWMDIIASKQEQLVQAYSLPISDVEILRSAHKYFPDNKLFREIPIQVLYVCMCIYVYVCVCVCMCVCVVHCIILIIINHYYYHYLAKI